MIRQSGPLLIICFSSLGFPKFVNWIMSCLKTISYTFNVNGELTTPFEAKKGLRQRDSMSPHFFVICMEYLNRCFSLLKTEKGFNFHPRCKKLNLTPVCFVDDPLVLKKRHSFCQMYVACFEKFSSVSGLKANLNKSSVYFGGVPFDVQSNILQEFQFSLGSLPFKYLGVPLSSKDLSVLQSNTNLS